MTPDEEYIFNNYGAPPQQDQSVPQQQPVPDATIHSAPESSDMSEDEKYIFDKYGQPPAGAENLTDYEQSIKRGKTALHPNPDSYLSETLHGAEAFGGEMLKGMPIVGRGIEPSVFDSPNKQRKMDMLAQYEREHPYLAAAGQTLGDVGINALLMAAIPESYWGVTEGSALEKLGTGPVSRMINDTAKQWPVNFGLTAGDVAAEKGKDFSGQDLLDSAGNSLGTSAANALLMRGLSPRAIHPDDVPLHYMNQDNPYPENQMTRSQMNDLKKSMPKPLWDAEVRAAMARRAKEVADLKSNPVSQETIDNIAKWGALGGTALGAIHGGHASVGAMMEALGGGLGGEKLARVGAPEVAKLWHGFVNNQAMTNPGNRALLRALSGAGSVGLTRAEDAPVQVAK